MIEVLLLLILLGLVILVAGFMAFTGCFLFLVVKEMWDTQRFLDGRGNK